MASDLDNKIVKQLEYYFGDINLPRDKFLQEKLKEDDGWVTLEVMLNFKKLASISDDQEVIAKAVENSDKDLIQLSEDKKKIRRNPEKPLPELNEERKKELIERSAYAKGFPLDEALNDIIEYLEPYGPIESVIKRMRDHKFKGSCFIVFKDIDTAKKFVEAENLKYKDIDLIRKLQTDYYADKKKEIEERKKLKQEKKQAQDDEASSKLEFPKNAIIFFNGIPDDKSLTREELKERIQEVGEIEVAYIDFNKGDTEGYARFGKEGQALAFLKKVTDNKMEIGEITLTLKALEGDEETEYLKKTSEAIVKMRNWKKNSRKRKGNFNNGGRNAKQSRKRDNREKAE